MRRGLALLLFGYLVATANADGCHDDDEDSHSSEEEDNTSMLGSRIGDAAFRLERLEARLQAIKDRLDEDDLIDHSLDVIAAVEAQEGAGCVEGEFRCGGSTMCVSTLLACDGTQDCPNNDDESEERCTNKALAGESFEGRIHWTGCQANDDSDITIAIIGRTDYNYFHSRTWISSRTTFDYGNKQHAFDSKGYIDYGTNGFFLRSNDHVNADCHFITPDTVDCVMEDSSGATCAHVRLHRV